MTIAVQLYICNVYITEQHSGNKSKIKAYLSGRALDSGCMTQICWRGTTQWHATANKITIYRKNTRLDVTKKYSILIRFLWLIYRFVKLSCVHFANTLISQFFPLSIDKNSKFGVTVVLLTWKSAVVSICRPSGLHRTSIRPADPSSILHVHSVSSIDQTCNSSHHSKWCHLYKY